MPIIYSFSSSFVFRKNEMQCNFAILNETGAQENVSSNSKIVPHPPMPSILRSNALQPPSGYFLSPIRKHSDDCCKASERVVDDVPY